MAIKATIQGLLIYAAMAVYVSAFVLYLLKRRRAGGALYLMGFLIAVAAFAYRWYDVQHVPFQNLFEVFLTLGMLVYPITVLCRRFLGVGGETADVLIGFIVLFPAGFVFNAMPQHLPPALQSGLFIPHVAAYMLCYVILAKAGVLAFRQLISPYPQSDEGDEDLVSRELGTYRMVCLGFPLLTLGLILGAWWGKLAWNDFWNWDPKELWSLVSWLVYVGYLHFRYMFGRKYPRANCAIAFSGLLAIIITLLWVNLSRIFEGMHNYSG